MKKTTVIVAELRVIDSEEQQLKGSELYLDIESMIAAVSESDVLKNGLQGGYLKIYQKEVELSELEFECIQEYGRSVDASIEYTYKEDFLELLHIDLNNPFMPTDFLNPEDWLLDTYNKATLNKNNDFSLTL